MSANPSVTPSTDAREFWKPQRPVSFRVDKCESCGNEMVIGSRFCHLCGAMRDGGAGAGKPGVGEMLDWTGLCDRLGLSSTAMVLLIVGAVCVLAALATGVLFTASTQTEWEAIQTWRIEWLLAALVSFVAAILLKR